MSLRAATGRPACTELQCPNGRFLTGCSVRGAAVPAALCAKAAPGGVAGTSGRTAPFDRSDTLKTAPKDVAQDRHEGQYADEECAAGTAFTGRTGSARAPDALHCRTLR